MSGTTANRAPSGADEFDYTDRDLDRFREVQQIAYWCAKTTADWLDVGVTEKQAAAKLRRELVRAGVQDFFHIPFAWFGHRSAFRRFRVPTQFFPTGKRLGVDMPFVVDCAPIIDGYTADIGYGGVFGSSEVWNGLDADLSVCRERVRELVDRGLTLDEVYRDIDDLIESQGNDNRHKVYPGRVIGHRVTRLKGIGPGRLTMFGFGVRTLQTLGREFIADRIKGRSPLWADGRASRHAPTPGLWAVEPHLGRGDVGLKFEELLVVTPDGAYWLDDDLPHVARWKSRKPAKDRGQDKDKNTKQGKSTGKKQNEGKNQGANPNANAKATGTASAETVETAERAEETTA
ncbi:M24 family metallopeptidase [Salininema proteolyticum]|uniref:M24 family metallopeptidase n=1 Tax=Salininema proteolyticum TaxID=1607685 RepID=A0ABV8U1Z9_9ACTN